METENSTDWTSCVLYILQYSHQQCEDMQFAVVTFPNKEVKSHGGCSPGNHDDGLASLSEGLWKNFSFLPQVAGAVTTIHSMHDVHSQVTFSALYSNRLTGKKVE